MINNPSILLRFFDHEEYARQFLKGEIRFGLLTYYKKLEGTRGDDKEGEASFLWNKKAQQITIDLKSNKIINRADSDQNISYKGFSINQRYILCTSHPYADIKKLKQKIGPFIVCINQPLLLLEKIKKAWNAHHLSLEDRAELKATKYNRDDLLEPDPYLIAPGDSSYTQKSKKDEYQKEYRYILTCRNDPKRSFNDHITIKIEGCDEMFNME